MNVCSLLVSMLPQHPFSLFFNLENIQETYDFCQLMDHLNIIQHAKTQQSCSMFSCPCREPSLSWLPTRRRSSMSTTTSASPLLDWLLMPDCSGRSQLPSWSEIKLFSEPAKSTNVIVFIDTDALSPTVTSCVRSAWTLDLSSTGPSLRHVSSLSLAAVSSRLLASSAVIKMRCCFF